MSEEAGGHLDTWVGETLGKVALAVRDALIGQDDWPDGMSAVFEWDGIWVRLTVEFRDEWEEEWEVEVVG